jgi:hypothetical protein
MMAYKGGSQASEMCSVNQLKAVSKRNSWASDQQHHRLFVFPAFSKFSPKSLQGLGFVQVWAKLY